MTFDEVASIFVLVMAAILLGWRYRPRAFFGRLWATIVEIARLFTYVTPEQEETRAAPIPTEQRSHAVERPREHLGTEDGNDVPPLVELLGTLDDDALLDILAGLRGEDGAYRFAESRVAKFIGGRVEDRLAQVREVRGTEKPTPPGRILRVRDERGERVISL